jgi:hypothetical protein
MAYERELISAIDRNTNALLTIAARIQKFTHSLQSDYEIRDAVLHLHDLIAQTGDVEPFGYAGLFWAPTGR